MDPGILETGKELTCGEIFLEKIFKYAREISGIFPFISLSGIFPSISLNNAQWGRKVIDFPRVGLFPRPGKFKILYLLLKIYQ